MTNEQKASKIRPWLNPRERITADFPDQRDLNVEVTGCTDDVVDLAIETAFAHVRQDVTVPLGLVEVGEDRRYYTRDSNKPLRQRRLRLSIDQKRTTVLSTE